MTDKEQLAAEPEYLPSGEINPYFGYTVDNYKNDTGYEDYVLNTASAGMPVLPFDAYLKSPQYDYWQGGYRSPEPHKLWNPQQQSLDAPTGPILPFQGAPNPFHIPKGTLYNTFRPRPGYGHVAHSVRNLNNIFEFRHPNRFNASGHRVATLKHNPNAQFPPTRGYGTANNIQITHPVHKKLHPGAIVKRPMGEAQRDMGLKGKNAIRKYLSGHMADKGMRGVRGVYSGALRSTVVPKLDHLAPPGTFMNSSLDRVLTRRHEFQHALDNSPDRKTGAIKPRGAYMEELRANTTMDKSFRDGLRTTSSYGYPHMKRSHVMAGQVGKAALAPTIPKFIPKGANLGMMIGFGPIDAAKMQGLTPPVQGYEPDRIPTGEIEHFTDPLSEPFPDNRRTIPDYPYETTKPNPRAGKPIYPTL